MNEKLENGLVRPHWVLTDPDEMNAFALLVSQLHPVKMLDVGMFLKRIGAISRSFRNFEIPSDTELFGFLAERLLRVFVLSHQYRVKELRVGQA